MRGLVVAAVLAALVATGRPAAAADADLVRVLDRLVAQQRQGGWLFWSPNGGRPEPLTYVVRWAERLAGPLDLAGWDVIVVRSPGTPAGGLALLAGHRLTGRQDFLAAATRAGDLLVATQLTSGGWFSEMAVEDGQLAPWFRAFVRRTMLDDDVTPGATRFLLALWQATGEVRYRAAAERGVALLLAAQHPSGSWPLVVRPRWEMALVDSHEDFASLNDGASSAAIETLLAAARALGREDCLAAARRGGEWILRVRGPVAQAGWAAQYDAESRPAAARPFEPPALATWETRHALDALSALAAATGERRWCAPVADAVAWLVRSALRPGCWARFHELGTNAPLYVGADELRVADPHAARHGYSWTGDFGIPALFVRLGLGPDGRPAVRPVRAPPAPLPGDPGTCPGDVPIGVSADNPDDARAQIARAGLLLATLEPPPPDPCALD